MAFLDFIKQVVFQDLMDYGWISYAKKSLMVVIVIDNEEIIVMLVWSKKNKEWIV